MPAPPTTGPSRALSAAAALVALEGAALLVAGVVYLVAIATGRPHNRGVALFGDALVVLAGAGLLTAARALARGRRWARAPVVLAQLLAVPVGAGLVHAYPAYGVPAVLLGVAVLLLLFTPGARRALETDA